MEENILETTVEYHELEDKWTLWFQKQQTEGTVNAKSWLESLKEVMTFGTVEEFWRMFNNIKTPNEMPIGTDYCVFKEGIEPKWESPEHKAGGVWNAQLPGSIEPEPFNKIWLYLLLACIGADFGHDDYDSITGLYLSIRKKNVKISIWCRTLEKENINRIGNKFKELLEEQRIYVKPTFHSFSTVTDTYKKTTKRGRYTPKKISTH